jgi:hypothetical protein
MSHGGQPSNAASITGNISDASSVVARRATGSASDVIYTIGSVVVVRCSGVG